MHSIRHIQTVSRSILSRWITSSRLDPDEEFRERLIRGLTLVMGLLGTALLVSYIAVNISWRISQPIGILLGLVAVVYMIPKNVTAAGWLLVGVCTWSAVASSLHNGYWTSGTNLTYILMLTVGALVLPPRSARWIPFLRISIYIVVTLFQYYSGIMPLPEGTIEVRPFDWILIAVIGTIVEWIGITYLLGEVYRQRNQLLALVKTLESRVEARTHDLEAAVEVSRQVAAEVNIHDLMQRMVTSTQEAYQLHHVAIFQYEPQTQRLVYAEGTGEAGLAMRKDAIEIRLDDDTKTMARIARERTNQILHNIALDENCPWHPYISEICSAFVLPLVTRQNELLGLFVLLSTAPERFGTDEKRVFTLLSQNLAVSMKNAELYSAQSDANERLRNLDNLKSQFLANVSHELQTPLSILLNFTEFVAKGLYGPLNERQQDALGKSLANGNHLLAQINDLRDMTRLEAGLVRLHLENNVNLNDELADIESTVRTLLQDKPVSFIADIDTDLPLITCDRRRLRQIYLNLLGNAAKFTEVGSITFSIKTQTSGVLLAIIDTGPGIASEELDQIFEPFHQAQAGLRHGGTGLGLAIARELVKAHGGTLTVDSTLGQGTAFYVQLPVTPTAIHQPHFAKDMMPL